MEDAEDLCILHISVECSFYGERKMTESTLGSSSHCSVTAVPLPVANISLLSSFVFCCIFQYILESLSSTNLATVGLGESCIEPYTSQECNIL